MATLEHFDWTHSFFELGPDFFQAKSPDPVAAPYIIDANPEEYRECGSFEIPDVEDPSWPHPVVSGGRLYLREQGSLYSYDIRAH